jgi:hypothetical protein
LGGDGRGAWVRRWRDLADLHMIDRGGPDYLSEGQKSLCRRAATLDVNLEQLEARGKASTSTSTTGWRATSDATSRRSASSAWRAT